MIDIYSLPGFTQPFSSIIFFLGAIFFTYLAYFLIRRGESLFLSKDFPCSQRGNPQKYRDKFKLLRKPQPSCSP